MLRRFFAIGLALAATAAPAMAGIREVPVQVGEVFEKEPCQASVMRVDWLSGADGSLEKASTKPEPGKGFLTVIVHFKCKAKYDPATGQGGPQTLSIFVTHKNGARYDEGLAIGRRTDMDMDGPDLFEEATEGDLAFPVEQITKAIASEPLTITIRTNGKGEDEIVHRNLKNPVVTLR